MNPYKTPTTQSSAIVASQHQFKQIVVAWEKLRLLYNCILLLVGIVALFVMINYYPSSTNLLIFQALFFAIFANFCFFAGPVCELYLRAFSDIRNAQSLRWILFVIGTIVSLIPALIMINSPGITPVF